MASISLPLTRRRFSWDALMVSLALAQAAVFLGYPSPPAIALGIWWNSNTIAHNFIHRPFFRSRAGNLLFGAFLSVLLGIPQRLWRDRHLAHHANVRPRLRLSAELLKQTAMVLESDPLERADLSVSAVPQSRWYEQNLRAWSAAGRACFSLPLMR